MSSFCSGALLFCWDGSYVAQDPAQNCAYAACPFQSGSLPPPPPFTRLCSCITQYSIQTSNNFCAQSCPVMDLNLPLINHTETQELINITDCFEIEKNACENEINSSRPYYEFCHDCTIPPPLPFTPPFPPDFPSTFVFQSGQLPAVPPPFPPPNPRFPLPSSPPLIPSSPPFSVSPPSFLNKSPPPPLTCTSNDNIGFVVSVSTTILGFVTIVISYVINRR